MEDEDCTFLRESSEHPASSTAEAEEIECCIEFLNVLTSGTASSSASASAEGMVPLEEATSEEPTSLAVVSTARDTVIAHFVDYLDAQNIVENNVFTFSYTTELPRHLIGGANSAFITNRTPLQIPVDVMGHPE